MPDDMPEIPNDWTLAPDGVSVWTTDPVRPVRVATVQSWPKRDFASQVVSVPKLIAALVRLLDEENPFITDADDCECRNGDGRNDDGQVCAHIQAARALAAAGFNVDGSNRSSP